MRPSRLGSFGTRTPRATLPPRLPAARTAGDDPCGHPRSPKGVEPTLFHLSISGSQRHVPAPSLTRRSRRRRAGSTGAPARHSLADQLFIEVSGKSVAGSSGVPIRRLAKTGGYQACTARSFLFPLPPTGNDHRVGPSTGRRRTTPHRRARASGIFPRRRGRSPASRGSPSSGGHE